MEGGAGQPFFAGAAYLAERNRQPPPALSWRLQRASGAAVAVGVDWWVWRLATSEHIRDSYADIMERWTFADALHGHHVVDFYEAGRPDPPKA